MAILTARAWSQVRSSDIAGTIANVMGSLAGLAGSGEQFLGAVFCKIRPKIKISGWSSDVCSDFQPNFDWHKSALPAGAKTKSNASKRKFHLGTSSCVELQQFKVANMSWDPVICNCLLAARIT
eukprot:1156527-Pelagomonas_calceolata.AAC.5